MNNETRNILMFAHTSLDLHQEERVFLTKKDKKTCEVRKIVVPLHQVSSNIYSFRFLVIGKKESFQL